MEWFKIYKVPAGKPKNEFAFKGQPQSRVCDYGDSMKV